MSHLLLVLLFLVLMLPGLVGVVVPALPGVPFMFIAALVFGVIDHFTHIHTIELLFLLSIAIGSLIIDYSAGTLGARWGGASAKATLAGAVGMIIGLILVPPLGSFIGMFLGIMYVELKSGDFAKALRAASGSLLGSLVGIIANLVLAFAFLGFFIIFALY